MQITKYKKRFVAISEYREKDIPKKAGFRWDRTNKMWWTDDAMKAAALIQYADAPTRVELEAALQHAAASREASRATSADVAIPAPAGLAYRPFQAAGIAYAMERANTLIGDEMGLGKTIQAIGLINADPTVSRALVICPASLRLNWQRELEKWLVRPLSVGVAVGKRWPDTSIVIINFDILARHRRELHDQTWDIMIVDECHFLKNPKAQRTQNVLGSRKRGQEPIPGIPARRKLFLTGTPIVNRPKELHPILQAIDPGAFGNFFAYATRYCGAYKSRWGWNFDGATNLDELQEKLRSTCMVRRLKADVLTELPPKQRQVIELPANGATSTVAAERAAWEAKEDMIAELRAAVELAKCSDDPADYDAAVQQLRAGTQAAFEEISILRQETAIAKVPYVVEHVKEALDAGAGKLVLFAHHHTVIDAYATAFGRQAVKLDGRDNMTVRDNAVQRFQNDPAIRVFVGGIHAAGVGLTLTAAAHVVFSELDWVPGNISQAEDRCHRIGQEDSVLVQHLVLEGSIDATMVQTIIEKQYVITEALDTLHAPTESVAPPPQEAITPVTEPEKAASQSASRRDIEREAKKLEPVEIAKIHADLRHLAEVCDGAHAKDGSGFNRYDSTIGKSLASANMLTKKQAALGKKITQKYSRQLALL